MIEHDLIDYLTMVCSLGGSDLHISANAPPMIRINGILQPLTENVLDAGDCRDLIISSLKETQRAKLEQDWELDFAIEVQNLGRFRGTAYYVTSHLEATFRHVPDTIPELTDLGHGSSVSRMCDHEHGLILITGSSGSGKTTTLASMVQKIAKERGGSIICIEDPVEYVFQHNLGVVRQRQVGSDTQSFVNALRSALRSDADVIVIGEMRDLETIRIAITAAETGHLVIGTLHTTDASTTVARILDAFPEEIQDYVSSQLAHSLIGVVCQHLITRKDEPGRVLATEIMKNNVAIAACIRSRRFSQLPGLIQIGGNDGMHTIDDSLSHLVKHGFISVEDALVRCRDKTMIMQAYQQTLPKARK
ncbi:type IV pilus twitching motility protein PilT [soil metagenome]